MLSNYPVVLTANILTPKKKRQVRNARRLMYCSIFYRVDRFVFAHIASFLDLRDQLCLRRLNIQLSKKLTMKTVLDSATLNKLRKVERETEHRVRDILFPYRVKRAIRAIRSCLERKLGRSLIYSKEKTRKLMQKFSKTTSSDIHDYRLLQVEHTYRDSHEAASILLSYLPLSGSYALEAWTVIDTGETRCLIVNIQRRQTRQTRQTSDSKVEKTTAKLNSTNLTCLRKAGLYDVFGKATILTTRHNKYFRG